MRNLSPTMLAAITANVVYPAILVDLTFKAGNSYVWSGIGSVTANGNTYSGVGSLGAVGTITEGITVEAKGTTVSLSGIDPTLYADSVADIVTGLPAKVWLACLNGNAVLDTYLLFSGSIDQPTVTENNESIDISIALESKLTNLQRANRKLWTAAEQLRQYPTDIGFCFIEALQDTANIWG